MIPTVVPPAARPRSAPRAVGVLLAVALAATAVLDPARGRAAPAAASLARGQAVFWTGPMVSAERVADPGLCGVAGACIDYRARVASAGARVLRVALQTPDESNEWGVQLIDPGGTVQSSGTTYELGGLGQNFNVEVWAHHPARGTWTVRVVPENVANGSFRMRAALDPAVHWPASDPHRSHGRRSGVYDVAPDLAADAPWALTFQQPTPMLALESGNVLAAAGLHHASASAGGESLYDCLPEETVEQGAHRCLRFSSGFANAGPGSFEVYGSSSAGPLTPSGGTLYQNVYRSNGSHWSRPAGMFMFHDIHLHYHVMGIATFEIDRVLAHHRLVKAGAVLKEGFCLGNVKIFDWSSFAQGEIDPNSQDNCEPSPQSDGSWRFYQGIESGWEDVYVWQTSGQFISFAGQPDGTYLLRMLVNPSHLLLEADSGRDHNDIGYTLFHVSGDAIRVLERGRGAGPWDPHKLVEDPVFGE